MATSSFLTEFKFDEIATNKISKIFDENKKLNIPSDFEVESISKEDIPKFLNIIDVSSNVSRSIIRKISGNEGKKQCVALLLGQLGKNHKDDVHRKKLITGKQLLGIAQKIIRDIQYKIGGRTLLVECKDCSALRNFYEECGFKLVNKSLNEDLLRYFISI